MFFINRYRRLKFISSRNNFQMQITISFLFSTLYRSRKIYQIPTLFQISRLQMAKNYRPRNCYQSATCNQSPKSELLSTANRYQMLQFIKRKLVSFLFFVVLGNELLDVTAYGLRSDFLSPETMPKATVELVLTKNRKLLLASVLQTALFYIQSYKSLLLFRYLSWLNGYQKVFKHIQTNQISLRSLLYCSRNRLK